MKMVYRKLCIYSKPIMPMVMGLCVGIALSLIAAPFLEEGCRSDRDRENPLKRSVKHSDSPAGNGAVRKPNSLLDKSGLDYGYSDDFEPRIRVNDGKPKPKYSNGKLLRPRYASTELGIREKLFVGVLTTKDSIDTLGIALNKTVTHFVTKLVFFMNMRGPSLPSGMSVVIFSDQRDYMLPFHMFKYIADHYVKVFDWFYFIKDDTYLRAQKLFDLINHLSISQDVHLGRPVTDPQGIYCDLGSGILLSQPFMDAIANDLTWCTKNAESQDHSENIGRCVLHASKQTCSDQVNGKKFDYFYSNRFQFDLNIPDLENSTKIDKILTIHKVEDDTDIYKLHRFFSQAELNRTLIELEKTKEGIVKMAPLTPGGQNASWPIGVDPPAQPKTRFDVIRWDYFNETHVFLENDFSNTKLLKGVHKQDIQDIIKVGVAKLNEKYQNRYASYRLLNGYRRFDPVRGMEYKLDLSLREKGAKTTEHRRVHLLRPLGFVEIVPIPYVTESSRVNLVLPVTIDDKDGVVSFLDSYAQTCLESGDNTYLFIVFIYQSPAEKTPQQDIYSVLKSMVSLYESKYQNGARIAWTEVHSSLPTPFKIMDTISRRFSSESLFLLSSVGMELSIDFLNRVRMNTIHKWQVFFPIAFWQYKPNLIYDQKPYPTTVEINKNVGHFDSNAYSHASFYNADYQYARKQMISTSASQGIDLFDMFIKYHTIHVFRAVEPALVMRYREQICKPTLSESDYQACLRTRAEGLASQSQLAILIFEHQQKVDIAHMNVMHQQNDPNVDQMKPNMLRK